MIVLEDGLLRKGDRFYMPGVGIGHVFPESLPFECEFVKVEREMVYLKFLNGGKELAGKVIPVPVSIINGELSLCYKTALAKTYIYHMKELAKARISVEILEREMNSHLSCEERQVVSEEATKAQLREDRKADKFRGGRKTH